MKIKSPNSNRTWPWWSFRLPLLTVTVTVSSTWVFRMYEMRIVPSTVEGYTTRQSEWSAYQWYPNSRSMLPNQRTTSFVCLLYPIPASPPCSTSSCTCPPYAPLLSATDHTTGHNFIHCVQLLPRGISGGTMNKLPLHTPHKGVLWIFTIHGPDTTCNHLGAGIWDSPTCLQQATITFMHT